MFKSFITPGTAQNKFLHIVSATMAFGIPVATLLWPTWQDISLGTIVYGVFNIIMHYAQE